MNRDMMRQMQQMQERIAKAQEQINSTVVEGTAGGGAVSIAVSGDFKVQSVKIAPEVVDPSDVEMLEDLVTAAVNEALQNIHGLQMQQMGSIASGLRLPGMR
jgi:DNA-binding YbaB/EbfC family protein